ncbi:MAG: peptidoglycan-binding domain-containing protein [Mycobacterium sp.]|nr:peptidoglycan-binding domain-containing protein [Mycobacterium sp.]
MLEMVLGRWRQGRQAEGATTESYRPQSMGGRIPWFGVGPFGTIIVPCWQDIPADAVVKLAFRHGPGGGAASHMWGEVDGMKFESRGGEPPKGGLHTVNARAINDSYAHAWAYLPGPIVEDGAPVPLGMGSTGPRVIALQQRLNGEGAGLDVDGDYGPATAAAVTAYEKRGPYAKAVLEEGRRRGITPRGIQIAFSVVFVESGWKMYANARVPESMSIPHDAVGSDYDSVGLFQQRCPMWGPAAVLMDPTKSAGLFYDRLVNVNLGTAQAPIRYDNPARLPGDFAAEVQRPAKQYRGRYQERMGHAAALYERITNPESTTDPIEELLMQELESWSIYATPGEPKIPATRMLQAIDAAAHRELVERAARLGDADSLARIARTAAGKGKYTDPAVVEHAVAVLADIGGKTKDEVRELLKG